MKMGALLLTLFISSVLNAAPTPYKSVVCTFNDKVISGVLKSQRVPKTVVNCSDSAFNQEIKTFSAGTKPKTKAELVEFLLSKGFEIKTDNIMVQKIEAKAEPKPEDEVKALEEDIFKI